MFGINRLHNGPSKHNRHAIVLPLQIYFEIQPAEGTPGINSYRSCCFLCSASSCNRRSIFSCFFPPFRERDDTLRANSLCFSSLSLCITQRQDIDKTGRNKAHQDLFSYRKKDKTLFDRKKKISIRRRSTCL